MVDLPTKRTALAILRATHASGSASRSRLLAITRLSPPTLSAACPRLIDWNLLDESAPDCSVVGRPAATVRLEPGRGNLVGVDIVGSTVRAETFDSALNAQTITEVSMPERERSLEVLAACVSRAVANESLRHNDTTTLGIGVAVPRMLEPTLAEPGAVRVDQSSLANLLGATTSAAITTDRPAAAVAVAEFWATPHAPGANFGIFNIGSEVDLALVRGGQVDRGQNDAEGRWGHVVLVPEGRPCRCGGRGCAEGYIGKAGIAMTLGECNPQHPLLGGPGDGQFLTGLSIAATAGDPDAAGAIEKTGYFLGLSLASVANATDPQTLFLTGEVAEALGTALLDATLPHLLEQAPEVDPDLVTVPIDGSNARLGMAIRALEQDVGTVVAAAAEAAREARERVRALPSARSKRDR